MGGIKTPIEIESNLSWNRLVRQSFQAIPVPESWDAQWRFQIPPVSYSANGFIYLVGVGSDSAPPTWRLGCSVRLASGAVPDSTGEFSSAAGLPLRIDDRRPCTLGSYTLLTWPDMNLTDPHLIVEFPHWLQDATIEIFWYVGETTGDFFSKLRESLVEIFGDTSYLDENLGQYIAAKTREAIQGHEASEDPHIRYLQKYEAAQQYLRIADLDVAIADSDALQVALNSYILKSEANAAFVAIEIFNQERTFVDAAIEEAKAIASADLAAHLGATNPHNITPQAIGALEEGFRLHDHDEEYAAIDHSHPAIEPTANLQANSLTLSQPLGLLGGGTGATTAAGALANLGAAAALHNHSGFDITSGRLQISQGGTGSNTADNAREALGAAAKNHTHKEFPIVPGFYSGWSQYGAPYTANYTKIDKLIVLCGVVKRTSGTETRIMLLSSTLRPSERKLFMCWSGLNGVYTPVRVDVDTDGIVSVLYPSLSNVSVNWISLDGIAFCIA